MLVAALKIQQRYSCSTIWTVTPCCLIHFWKSSCTILSLWIYNSPNNLMLHWYDSTHYSSLLMKFGEISWVA